MSYSNWWNRRGLDPHLAQCKPAAFYQLNYGPKTVVASGQRVVGQDIITRWPVSFLSSRCTYSAHYAALASLLMVSEDAITVVGTRYACKYFV